MTKMSILTRWIELSELDKASTTRSEIAFHLLSIL